MRCWIFRVERSGRESDENLSAEFGQRVRVLCTNSVTRSRSGGAVTKRTARTPTSIELVLSVQEGRMVATVTEIDVHAIDVSLMCSPQNAPRVRPPLEDDSTGSVNGERTL